MIPKTLERERAIELRKNGFTYSEILEKIPVAKSSLSLWLRSVGLSKRVKHRLTERKRLAQLKGAEARRKQRILRTNEIFERAEKDIKYISRRELWLMGIMLYWAEGSKEKPNHPGSGVQFGNSDPDMIKLFLKWLYDVCNIGDEKIKFEIYIHENSKNNLAEVKRYWSKVTNYPIDRFSCIYFKKNKIKTNRKNTGSLYYGLLRVRVRSSSILNREVAGWVRAISKRLPGGVIGNTPAFEAGDTRFKP